MATLADEITARAREIKTDGYPMSIGELRSIYERGDIQIHPTFQRYFRWNRHQKSNLIESFFLGIPVPPVFVAQREDGIWDVVDGVQRLSTILQFLGVLRDRESGEVVSPAPLGPGEYLESLKGVVFDEGAEALVDRERFPEPLTVLDEARQRDFLRSKLSIQIIEKVSDPQAKFDLFQRLNSGARLSEQEIRNCLTVMLDETFYDWLAGLANYPAFVHTIASTERKTQEQYPTELVLRFLAGVRSDAATLAAMDDMSSFLDDQVKVLATDPTFDRAKQADDFRQTFDLLDGALGEFAFRRWDGQKHAGQFSISLFEVLAVGLASNLSSWTTRPVEVAHQRLRELARELWSDETFLRRSGSGQRGSYRMPALVQLGEQFVRP